MLLYVYSLRSNGRRLPGSEQRLREPARGSLYFGPTPLDDYGPRMQARLLDPSGADLISPLQFAKIARVEGVMHITGIEYYLRGRKGSPQRYKQSWLCACRPEDALTFLDRIHVPDYTGFGSDTDDDVSPLNLDAI